MHHKQGVCIGMHHNQGICIGSVYLQDSLRKVDFSHGQVH